ncbi:Eco57I restriction-modification methylase domain-containing protein [Rufibacter immobilis]|uniref:Eco57I restriction-modification methylase domain-containing protein n=1 Tax=Rufibacter immobilis TaxID=1348778 RepID=UPI0035E72756
MTTRKERLKELIDEYKLFKSEGRLEITSEETIRTWINELLSIFGWDVKDTSQILQEKVLSRDEKEKLVGIGSTYTRPDYTFKTGDIKLTFLDAKGLNVDLFDNKDAAFQIKSYGWSIMAPCAYISNFEEFVIYDCTYIPNKEQPANFGRIYFTLDEYLDNFEVLELHLLRKNIVSGLLIEQYSNTLITESSIRKLSPDFEFAEQLSSFRLALATDILKLNTKLLNSNSELLSYLTQVIINRILFIRICEARKIEKDGLLLEFKDSGFWQKFKDSSYNIFYDHYDGPLFDRIKLLQVINVSDDVFTKLIDALYYPSPYRFDVIQTKLLSDIYEIFLSKKLVIEGNELKEKLKLEYIKTNGAVSTPQYLVDDLIKRTIIGKEIASNGLEGILNTKTLDFACGSGIFIIQIYEYLHNLFIECYLRNPDPNFAHLFFDDGAQTTLTLEGKRQLISNCIHGIDIDPEAVEVARMSLSLKVIDSFEFHENYTDIGIYGKQILNNVGSNIKCGNALVQNDIIYKYPDISSDEEQLIKTNPFDWNSPDGFKSIFDFNNGFDYILSNPPYVAVTTYKAEYPLMHQYIKSTYDSTTNGKVDLSVAFIEKAISLLNSKGKLGLIIQKRFFKTDYGKKIREFITSNKLLNQVIDFTSTEIFKSRITYIASIILDNSKKDKIIFHKVAISPNKTRAYLEDLPIYENERRDFTAIPALAINKNPWNFDDEELLKVNAELLIKHGSFGNFAKVRVGIQVLWDRAYHIKVKSFNDDGTLTGDTHIEKDITLEIEACRPLIVNQKFYPFCKDTTNTYVLFPYDVIAGSSIPIEFKDYNKRYPLAGGYLLRHKSLIRKSVETFDENENWHLFTRANNHQRIYPKVLLPMTANDTYASITKSNLNYCDNANMFYADLPSKSDNYLYATAGIINSVVFSVCARLIANPQQNGYFKFNKQFLEPIPFPKKEFVNNPNLVKEIALISKEIEDMQNRYFSSSPRQKIILKTSLTEKWNVLDNKVYLLYDLNKPQKEFFINRGRNINRLLILD